MKIFPVISAAAVAGIAAWVWAGPNTIEAARSLAEQNFQRSINRPAADILQETPPAGDLPEEIAANPLGDLLEIPALSEPMEKGAIITRCMLEERLDSHRNLLTRTLGDRPWNISMASDSRFKAIYFTFASADAMVLRRIGNLDQLRKEGISVQLTPQIRYHLKVSPNIFDPIRGSTLRIDPIKGTVGPAHRVPTGALLDLLRAKSLIFMIDGREYWMLFGTDVNPATDLPANTRSLLFIHENGLDTRGWPVAENALPQGKSIQVSFGDRSAVLLKTAQGVLEIYSVRPLQL